MPAMLRPDKKAEKIIFKILGTPANLQPKRGDKKKEQIDQKILLDIKSRDR